jgi:hypothetical protein
MVIGQRTNGFAGRFGSPNGETSVESSRLAIAQPASIEGGASAGLWKN